MSTEPASPAPDANEANATRKTTMRCPKVPHVGDGYLHDENDDGPYSVDGLLYCGRCHYTVSKENGRCERPANSFARLRRLTGCLTPSGCEYASRGWCPRCEPAASPAPEETRGPTNPDIRGDLCPRCKTEMRRHVTGPEMAYCSRCDLSFPPAAVSPVEQPSEPETVAWAIVGTTGRAWTADTDEGAIGRRAEEYGDTVVPLVRRSDYESLAAHAVAVETEYREICLRLRETATRHKLSEKIDQLVCDTLDTALARVSSLESQLGEAQKDAEMLDWLESSGVDVYFHRDERAWDLVDDTNEADPYRILVRHSPTLRVAIDAARAIPSREQP